MTLSLLINETLKWLSSLPILMQESFCWWQCSDRHIISLFPHLHTPFPPFYPSLISLMVCVDVKHHAYLFTGVRCNNHTPEAELSPPWLSLIQWKTKRTKSLKGAVLCTNRLIFAGSKRWTYHIWTLIYRCDEPFNETF